MLAAENFSGSAIKLTEEEQSALASFQRSEKLLQDLIERKVLQHTLKVLHCMNPQSSLYS